MSALAKLIYPFRRPAPPAAKPAMGFFTDSTLCIGCKACEVACKQWNQLPSDGFEFIGDSYDNTKALSATTWRHVIFVEQFPERRRVSRGSPPDPAGAGDSDRSRNILSRRAPVNIGPGPLADDERRVQALQCRAMRSGLSDRRANLQRILQRLYPERHLQRMRLLRRGLPVRRYHAQSVTTATRISARCATTASATLSSRRAPRPALPTRSSSGRLDELRERAAKRVSDLLRAGLADAYLYGDQPSESYSSMRRVFAAAR